MNPDTRVVICCYAGDAHQLYMPAYLHHGCPVTILSPEDSPVTSILSGAASVDFRSAGKRAYIGQDSLDRQLEHLKLMLTYPENYFLIHDSDSLMLDPKIPDYLYAEPDHVWSNQVFDAIPEHQPFFPHGWPHVAFQPPYFLSRKTVEAMIAVADHPFCQASPCMPFIDFYMVQLTTVAGLSWRRFNDCISCQITADPRLSEIPSHLVGHYASGLELATRAVRDSGANILHSVKDPGAAKYFLELRQHYLSKSPDAPPRFRPAPRIGGGRIIPADGPGLKA
jgi:hypothetical protein